MGIERADRTVETADRGLRLREGPQSERRALRLNSLSQARPRVGLLGIGQQKDFGTTSPSDSTPLRDASEARKKSSALPIVTMMVSADEIESASAESLLSASSRRVARLAAVSSS